MGLIIGALIGAVLLARFLPDREHSEAQGYDLEKTEEKDDGTAAGSSP